MQEMGNRRFAAFLAQQSDNVEKRRSVRVLAPDWMQNIMLGATWPKLTQSRQQQHAVGGYGQSWMTWHRLRGPNLCLAHPENIFFIAVIDFDLPAIKAGLDQQLRAGKQIRGQEVSRLAVVGARMFGKLVRHGSNHQQAQGLGAAAALPQYSLHLFIFHLPTLAAEVHLQALPGALWLLAHLFGRESVLIIFAALAAGRREAKARIFAAAGQHLDIWYLSAEDRLITEAAISNHQQQTASGASFVQIRAQATHHLQRLPREILHLLELFVFLALLFAGALARLLQNRCCLKANRNGARRVIAFTMMRKQQRSLQETQAKQEIHMKGRRQRVTLPGGARNLSAGLFQLGVIYRGHDRPFRIALQMLIDDWLKQALRLPAAAREELVVGAPILSAAPQHTKRARDGASAQDTRQGKRVLHGAAVSAGAWESQAPAPVQQAVQLGAEHCYSPPFSAKTFLSVRTKRSPRLTFLTSVETIDSRSSLKPCSFSTRSMISETWSGLPARRSTSCTISICDVPLRAAFGSRGPARRRLTALSWASSETSTACRTAASTSSFSMTASSLGGLVVHQSKIFGRMPYSSTYVNSGNDLRTSIVQTPEARLCLAVNL